MEHLEIDFARGLKALAGASLFLGFSFLYYVINIEWIHWPGIILFIFVAIFTFLFNSMRMFSFSKRSIVGALVWLGMAYLSVVLMFRICSWPGGTILGFYGVPNLIIIVAAIIYLRKLPQEQSWARKAIGWWSIGIPLASCLLWYAMYVYQMDSFEPAIPYSDYCVEYYELRLMKRRILTLGSGIAYMAFSIPLYIVARKHSK